MADTKPFDDGHPEVDPERKRPQNAFDHDGTVFGQSYAQDRERREGEKLPSGSVAPGGEPGYANVAPPHADIPPDNGRRASFDPKTGEVHGSGVGAGGGASGEDFASDAPGGDGALPSRGAEPDVL
jgi:hypothetical protein